MSNTPLEQNGADLLAALAAINELPEYQEIAPEVGLDFFSLYDAVKIAEWENTINLETDTTFDPTDYVDNSGNISIRDAESVGNVVADLTNYIYVATAEWFFVPKYKSETPPRPRMVSKAGVHAHVFSQRSDRVGVANIVLSYISNLGIETERADAYGIYFYSPVVPTISSGKIYWSVPPLTVRTSSSLATADSLRDIDAANSNFKLRFRIYRLPHDQWANAMYAINKRMVANEQFDDGGADNGD